jgi:hypothetical protein
MSRLIPSNHPSFASLSRNLHDDATCTTHAVSPPVLRPDWETLAWLTCRQSKPLDLDACPAPSSSSHWFCGATNKLSTLSFETQTKNLQWWFCGLNHQTAAAGFEVQSGKPDGLGFEAQPRNPHSSSPSTRCMPYTASSDLSIVWPLSTWPVLDHH